MGQVCPVKQEEEAHGKHRWGAAGTWLAAGTQVAAGTWLAVGTPRLGGAASERGLWMLLQTVELQQRAAVPG